MKTSELRQSILQVAVQGKLVPQNLHDEPASELLERIRAEKSKLIKEGKIKKEKPLPLVTEDEVPYDLPEGWVWCRLGDLGITQTGTTPSENKQIYLGDYIPFIKPADITNYGIDYFNEGLSEKGLELGRLIIAPAVVMVCIGGSIGKCFYTDKNISRNQQINAITPYFKEMTQFIHYSVIAPFFYESIKSEAGGTATPIINKSKWSSLLFPVPPFQEQQRIVAKVDELMAMCDELEAAESELEAMEEHFIEYLPKSILQMAVQGKLVPQDLHDEPASELLERIHAEKAKLIKEGKIKKEKPLPPITDDEIPYDLPEGWIWCRLGDIHSIHRGITFPAAAKYKEAEQGLICCATTGSVQAKYNPNADVFVPAQYIKNEGQWLQTNDIIMSTANSRELVGKTCIWEGAEPKTFGGFLTVIRAVSKLLPAYSYYTIQYLWKSGAFTSSATQTTNIANINNNILNETLFPLPPLAEQQRIVAKADELLDLCDELKTTKSAPVKKSETDSNIVSLPQVIEQEEEIGIAARGDATQPYSPKLQDTISKLLGDESCE